MPAVAAAFLIDVYKDQSFPRVSVWRGCMIPFCVTLVCRCLSHDRHTQRQPHPGGACRGAASSDAARLGSRHVGVVGRRSAACNFRGERLAMINSETTITGRTTITSIISGRTTSPTTAHRTACSWQLTAPRIDRECGHHFAFLCEAQCRRRRRRRHTRPGLLLGHHSPSPPISPPHAPRPPLPPPPPPSPAVWVVLGVLVGLCAVSPGHPMLA